MVRYRVRQLTALVAAILMGSGFASVCQARPGGGGHGGGAGHTVAAPGCFRGRPGWGGYGRGFYGYGYPGFYGYGLGLGLGLGVGYGLGYGYGYDYGYPYYYPGYYGYPCPVVNGYPVVVNPGGGTPVAVNPATAGGPGLPPGPYAQPTSAPAGSQPSSGQGGVQPTSASGQPSTGGPVQLTDSDVLLNIRVPASATVRINGAKTTQVGSRREFISSGLVPGRTYTFVINVQWEEAIGRPVHLERRLQVQGGERRNLDFTQLPLE